MTTTSVSREDAAAVACDALVVPTVTVDGAASVVPAGALPAETLAALTAQLTALDHTGAAEKSVTLAAVPGVAAPRVVVVGLGDADAVQDATAVVKAVGAAVRGLAKAPRVAVLAPSDATAGAAAQGAVLGAYRFTALKGARTQAATTTDEVVVVAQGDVEADVERATTVAQEVCYARDLVNTAPNVLYPQTFAQNVREHAQGLDHLTVDVLDDEALLAGGYGGIMGVGQGSAHRPRLVTMSYAPQGATAHLALVGKGITFDSGGLDIKPADGMWAMKSDMAGAAAVAATVVAAARLGLPVAVTGVLGLAENMPSATAQRASDVVTMHDGTTVEIMNTDAEGRMVLADAMLHAAKSAPSHMIDIATLTGAQVIALGNEVAAVMANDDDFRSLVVDAAGSVGEDAWPMPLPKALRADLDSDTADLRHKGGRAGGMLTAGLFLAEFVPGAKEAASKGARGSEGTSGDAAVTPWAHIDIAGPSFNEGSPRGATPKGGTGYGVTTMLAVAQRLAEQG